METPNQHNVIRRTVESFQPDTAIPDLDPDCEVSASRTLLVPCSVVLKAFGDHELIAQWWGPQGWRTTTKHLDFRPGGVWQHTMKGPDREERMNYVKYLQTGPETIDYVHGTDESTIDFRAVITLEEQAPEQTELTFRIYCVVPEVKQMKIDGGLIQGLESTLDRLEALLSDPTGTDKESM